MIKRVCPLCGKEHYSAVKQDDWTCNNCGCNLTPEMNEPIANFDISGVSKTEKGGQQWESRTTR